MVTKLKKTIAQTIRIGALGGAGIIALDKISPNNTYSAGIRNISGVFPAAGTIQGAGALLRTVKSTFPTRKKRRR